MLSSFQNSNLNSVNPNTKFTFELENTDGQGLPFLDTITSRHGTEIQLHVYRNTGKHRPLSQFLFALPLVPQKITY